MIFFSKTKEQVRLYNMRYREKHCEKIRELKKRYYEKNCEKIREKHREASKQYRKENRKQISERSKQNYKINREKILERNKRYRQTGGLLKIYGISSFIYWLMSNSQNHKCLCGRDVKNRLCVDHDHRTNEVRELLCSQCNIILGLANDNPVILIALADYLIKYKKGNPCVLFRGPEFFHTP